MARLKRNEAQILLDRIEVAKMLLEEMTQSEIGAAMSALRGVPYSRQVIEYDIKCVKAEWKAEAREKVGMVLARELASVRSIRKKALSSFKKSEGDVIKSRVRNASDGKKKGANETTVEKQTKTGDAGYLVVALKCNERICKMLGIDQNKLQVSGDEDGAPIPVEVGTGEGGFLAVFGMSHEEAEAKLRETLRHEIEQQKRAESEG